MTSRLLKAALALAVWSLVVMGPIAALTRSWSDFRSDDLRVVGLLALLGCVVVGTCLALCTRLGTVAAVCVGVSVGLALPVVAAFVSGRVVRGFEASAAVFIGLLEISLPSAIGGGAAGWILRKVA